MINGKTIVNVIGIGYVGQTLAITLAENGAIVYGTDKDEAIIGELRQGHSTIKEPGIDELIAKQLGHNFFVCLKNEVPYDDIDVYIMCVGSFIDQHTKEPVISSIINTAETIRKHLRRGQLVILRSTVPIGTTGNAIKPVLEKSGLKAGEDFGLAFAPERTSEGAALKELRLLPQIIGGINGQSIEATAKIFERFAASIVPVSSLEAAEAAKLLANSYLDVKFAFINEAAKYFERIGLNAFEITRALRNGKYKNDIPIPSPGVGGACLSKEPYLFVHGAKQVSETLTMVSLAREINENIPARIIARIKNHTKLMHKKVFVAGLAFKGQPETNDIRASSSVDLIRLLKKEGALISGYDPCVERYKIEDLGIQPVSDLKEGVLDSDITVFMTNHTSFGALKLLVFRGMIKPDTILFDGWGLFNPEEARSCGFRYMGVGIGGE